MVNVFWFVPYVAAGGLMWFIAYQMAPIGREIPLSHAVSAVILMGCCGVAARNYLKPLVGNWEILFEFVAQTLVVMAILPANWRQETEMYEIFGKSLCNSDIQRRKAEREYLPIQQLREGRTGECCVRVRFGFRSMQ